METLAPERSDVRSGISLVAFDSTYRAEFARLNYQWIEKYFSVEPVDRRVLDHPEEEIIAHGGQIFFAILGARAIGTVALKVESDTQWELTKMAVEEAERGKGIGRLLLQGAVDYACAQGVKRLVLSSHTSLVAAIAMYRAAGFIECRDRNSCYARCNIYMQKDL